MRKIPDKTRLRRYAHIPFANEERPWSHMILHTKLDMADTWSEDVEARLIISWQKLPLLYLISITFLNERAFREIAEEI